jgi:predicted DNA-binding WGR domain protein
MTHNKLTDPDHSSKKLNAATQNPEYPNLLTVAFEAHNAAENHHRRYSITVGRDLLNDWTIRIRYGRIGQRGQEICVASREPGAMQSVLRERLRRRLSAPKRIGCPYRLTMLDVASGFDSSDWLPKEVVARFL